MKRSLKLLLIIFLSSTSLMLSQTNKKVKMDKNFTHVVYFWLKNPEKTEDRKAFETSLKKFMKNSKYAQTKFIGVPANTPREVVDNSFTYSLILSFPSREVQDLYQHEDAHLLFIKESEHLWKKVQVYDSVGID
ncbi:stress responsive protein [Christiangramia fulva]|uniref:Stress responsive protein n=1 Tax=Christiangramia fulva TaxID=2126553 RepID=A0A2R3Z4F0_9FLAO|nr:Dabb family protein [Christiangramia fulva]AVR45139.1 stress responsive protein [Christiangramia fulva]